MRGAAKGGRTAAGEAKTERGRERTEGRRAAAQADAVGVREEHRGGTGGIWRKDRREAEGQGWGG